jgi:guanylate kinase
MKNSTGRLFVVSAPSGAGKTSLVRALLAADPALGVSVSHTTRPPREREVPGRDYCFVDKAEFQRLVAADAFLEHAQVFDHCYGTARAQIAEKLARGLVLLEIDWQGARQVKRARPDCVSIFILPPSRRILEQRLRSRGTDSDAVIARRLRDAAGDMSHCLEFDYAVVNEDFAVATASLQQIIAGQAAGQATELAANRPEIQALLATLVA